MNDSESSAPPAMPVAPGSDAVVWRIWPTDGAEL